MRPAVDHVDVDEPVREAEIHGAEAALAPAQIAQRLGRNVCDPVAHEVGQQQIEMRGGG